MTMAEAPNATLESFSAIVKTLKGQEKVGMDDIETLMKEYRGLDVKSKVQGFDKLLKELPREHMAAQLGLLGIDEESRDACNKRYQDHLTFLKDNHKEWAAEAAVVARTLLHLHSQAQNGRVGPDVDGGEDKLPPLWKRLMVIPFCLCTVLIGFVVKSFVEDTYYFAGIMFCLSLVSGGGLMYVLDIDGDEDAYGPDYDKLLEQYMAEEEQLQQEMAEKEGCKNKNEQKKIK